MASASGDGPSLQASTPSDASSHEGFEEHCDVLRTRDLESDRGKSKCRRLDAGASTLVLPAKPPAPDAPLHLRDVLIANEVQIVSLYLKRLENRADTSLDVLLVATNIARQHADTTPAGVAASLMLATKLVSTQERASLVFFADRIA